MFWHKNNTTAPAPTSGYWISPQVLLCRGAVVPSGLAPDWQRIFTSPEGKEPMDFIMLGFADNPEASMLKRELPGIMISTLEDFAKACGPAESLPSFAAQAMGCEMPSVARFQLAEGLLRFRDRLRPRLPSPVIGGQPALCADLLARTGENGFYIRGWWRNCFGGVTSLLAHSPEGASVDLAPRCATAPRADIRPAFSDDRYTAFHAYFEMPAPSVLNAGWLLELRTSTGFVCEAPAPPVEEEDARSLDLVLHDLRIESPPNPGGVAVHIEQAVQALLLRRRQLNFMKADRWFGTPCPRPRITVLVPLYRRIEFLEHQLAQFAADSDWEDCELLYLLDSPEDAERLLWQADFLHRLYRRTFRVVVPDRTTGYSTLNNMGARLARADMLLFLNSDVLPAGPGWLTRLLASYRNRPMIGALGPKLLFEDESIQHAGESYAHDPDGFGWLPLAYFKGMHRGFAPANLPREVPAVSGACLMVARTLFEEAGGFDEGYVQGDYEDLDLCLRLASMGRKNWYDPSIELYHLEGSSYPSPQRIRNSTYNRWRHALRWGKIISAQAAREQEAHESAMTGSLRLH